MQRRQFLSACAAIAGASRVGAADGQWTSATPKLYSRSRLVDPFGDPIKVAELAAKTNYVFQYPFAGTPCFLLNLGRPLAGADKLQRADGAPYSWSGGVGRQHSIVAYSAICAHKLVYPTREVSFIRFQSERSPTSDGNVIHCCADHSVYDPSAGARVLSGPAPQPLAAILLQYDAERDELAAMGTVGAEQFDAFFNKYDFKLAMEYGQGRAHASVGATTVVREMTQYCRQTVQC
jgi:arsenite oxidase small subunit